MSKPKKQRRDQGALYGQARETAWDQIGQEAVRRAGRGPQLKGVIHEVAIREQRNLSPGALLGGQRTSLTRSAHARTVDLVTTQDGRVAQRLQVKDITSQSGLRDLQGRVERGQYRSARLVGTRETAARWNQSNPTKKMESSGFSSQSTTRAADNAGARVPNRDLFKSNAQDIAQNAGMAGIIGAVAGAGAEAWNSHEDYREGHINSKQYAGRIAKSGAASGVSATAKTGAALALKEVAKEAAKRGGAETLKRLAGSNAGTAVAFGVVEQGYNTIQYARGEMDGQEYAIQSSQTVGSTGGAIGGAAAGAALGSVVPGLGTVVGGVVGGLIGAVGGSLGRKAGDWFFKK